MTDAFDRILEINITADESADTIDVTGVTFYRNRQSLDDGEGFSPGYSDDGFAATNEVVLHQTIPPPTIVRLVSTFQA